MNESDINDVLNQSIVLLYQTRKSLCENISGLIINSVIDYDINISKYKPLAGISYIKLPKELDHPRKVLINIQNIGDNKCFKWFLVRYFHPTDYHSSRITKVMKFPVKIRDMRYSQN